MAVSYEWIVEELSQDEGDDPDIVEVHHFESYAEALASDPRGRFRIGVVRDVGNSVDGLTDRSWAYVEGGKLPSHFDYGAGEEVARVPKFISSQI